MTTGARQHHADLPVARTRTADAAYERLDALRASYRDCRAASIRRTGRQRAPGRSARPRPRIWVRWRTLRAWEGLVFGRLDMVDARRATWPPIAAA